MELKIDELQQKYPALQVKKIGKTVLERNIYALCIGNMEQVTYYAGGFHSLEYLTPLVLFRFAESLLEALQTGHFLRGFDVSRTTQDKGVVITPCVNIDGLEVVVNGVESALQYAEHVYTLCDGNVDIWQANVRGVDINHNFDAGYSQLKAMEVANGIKGPAPTRYGGPFAESEPETRAVADFCRKNPVRQALAFHSQGEEIFWQYGEKTPSRARLVAEILSSSSGYELIRQGGLASHGGFKDWFIDKLHRPGFTIETGKGKNPLPLADFPGVYEKIEEMMVLASII